MTLRKNIRVHPSIELLDPGVKEALERLAPVRLTGCADIAGCNPRDAIISLSGDDSALESAAQRECQCFHVAKGVAGLAPLTGNERVRFETSGHLDQVLRGRSLWHKPLPDLPAVRRQAGDQLLASYGDRPVWVLRKTAGGWANVVSAPLPKLTGKEQVFDYLDGLHFIQLLPLLHFLREAAADVGWQRPPLRACLMFDDPNLHWSSYGCVRYQEVVRLAKEWGFHVAFATVPIDAWGSHRRTVQLFRENPDHLSLLIHGNDHLREELGRFRAPEGHLQVLAQSLRRIARLEAATGLEVSRVMVPPHEAFTDAVLPSMLALGFEGACLSSWSLRNWNPQRPWPPSFGLEAVELLDGGFPVLPRFEMSDSCEGLIVMAGFLGHPIIALGHHESVAGGLELLTGTSKIINSLGDVSWSSPIGMLRSNYLLRQEHGVLRLKPYSCRMHLTVLDGINALVVEPPGEQQGSGECEFTLQRKSAGTLQRVQTADQVPVQVVAGESVELAAVRLGSVDWRAVASPRFSPWVLPRRFLCEGRDRLSAFMTAARRA